MKTEKGSAAAAFIIIAAASAASARRSEEMMTRIECTQNPYSAAKCDGVCSITSQTGYNPISFWSAEKTYTTSNQCSTTIPVHSHTELGMSYGGLSTLVAIGVVAFLTMAAIVCSVGNKYDS